MAYRDWYCEDVLSGKMEIRKVWEDNRFNPTSQPVIGPAGAA